MRMLAHIRSTAILGIEAYPVDVEVDIANGLPSFLTVGLPHGAVKEGRERVSAALVNAGFDYPLKRITVNLAPADIRKDGSAFDLPIAVGILVASGQLPGAEVRLSETLFVGELGLEGDLRPIRGALAMALAARAAGCRLLVLPEANLPEAAVVEHLDVVGARRLGDVAAHLTGERPLAPTRVDMRSLMRRPKEDALDFAEVRGQAMAKRALEVAAAGAHNLLLRGPPGAGKTMLARRLPTILPAMDLEEALEITKIHGIAGTLLPGAALVPARPFRAPHHTISDAGLVGGGSWPRPGEVSLAHGGVLFLDELPEFRRHVLESLRQPMEDGLIALSRAAVTVGFPARFMLIAAMNPCPCGYAGDPLRACRCDAIAIERYRARLSGPLLDRIDLHLDVPAVPPLDLFDERPAEASAVIRERIELARERQRRRFRGQSTVFANAHLSAREVRHHCRIDASVEQVLRMAVGRLGLSVRACHRVLKVARTIADLAGVDALTSRHVQEAIRYRGWDRAPRRAVEGGER